jgi:hypothetical protein
MFHVLPLDSNQSQVTRGRFHYRTDRQVYAEGVVNIALTVWFLLLTSMISLQVRALLAAERVRHRQPRR